MNKTITTEEWNKPMGLKELEIVSKMLRCRKSMQSLWGNEYPKKVKFWKDLILNHNSQTGMDTLKSVLVLLAVKEIGRVKFYKTTGTSFIGNAIIAGQYLLESHNLQPSNTVVIPKK